MTPKIVSQSYIVRVSGLHWMSWLQVQFYFSQTTFRYPAIFFPKEKYIRFQSGLPMNKQLSEGQNELCDARWQGASPEGQSSNTVPILPLLLSQYPTAFTIYLYRAALVRWVLVRQRYLESYLTPRSVEMLPAVQISGSYLFLGHIFCFAVFYACGINIRKKKSLLRVWERESGRFAKLLLGCLFCQLPLTLLASVAIWLFCWAGSSNLGGP